MADDGDRPVVLITGASSWLGAAIARRLAETHVVVLTGHRGMARVEALAGELGGHALRADLSDPSAAPDVVARAVAAAGRLDALVNAAGIVEANAADDPDAVPIMRQMAVNVASPMALIAAAVPHLACGGAVVNVTSINADLAPPGAAGYAASKAALEAATRALARDLAVRGIRVNAVQPGAVEKRDDPRGPEMRAKFESETWLGRIGTGEDFAGPVAFLLSDDARWITGEVLRVAGGFGR